MEQNQLSCGPVHDGIPPLSPKYQWFVAQNKDGKGDHFFFNIHDPLSFYRCRIPELHNRRIRGSFHGWLILSNDNLWSLWNPATSNIIHLPPLVLTDGYSPSIKECCLSLPPDDPNSVLLLTIKDKPRFVFCLLNRGRKRLKWTEKPYIMQLLRVTGLGCVLYSLCCCNGKVYALNSDNTLHEVVIEIGIVVRNGRVVIKLMPFSACPHIPYYRGHEILFFLGGFNTELFCILIGLDFKVTADMSLSFVALHKLDMTIFEEEEVNSLRVWEQIEDLKEGNLFVDLGRDNSVAYSPTIASEFGGKIHICSRMGKVIYSYDLSDRTILLSSMFPSPLLPTSHFSVWECRLAVSYAKVNKEIADKDGGIVARLVNDNDDVELDESQQLNLPFGVFDMIMEFCIGLEYLNFRATCKRCHLAAPVGGAALKRLQNYSLLSPWLMLADKKRGIVTLEDPFDGNKYFMKKLHAPISDGEICFSHYGWLLYYTERSERGLVFCNPFTNEVHDLPEVNDEIHSLCFSAPPTSPDCMVVGFGWKGMHIHFVHGEQTWRLVSRLGSVDYDNEIEDNEEACPFFHPIFYGRDLYALCLDGQLSIFKNLGQEDYSLEEDVVEAPRSCARLYPVEYFLTKCDQHVLLVFVDHFGESIEIFRLNDLTKEWEKTNGLGRHTIYISDSACLCIEAKTPEMEDKIFFARFYYKNGKVVFYSFESGMYHTFNDKNIEESFGDFVGTKHPLYAHAWIEPTWGAIKPFAV